MDDGLTPGRAAQVKELARSGFLPTLEENAKTLTAPFYWYDPAQPLGQRTLAGGTICFVDTGETILGLSAAHVHRDVTEQRAGYPHLACQIGGHSFDPEERLIDIDHELDLVTYRLSEIQVAAARGHIHHPSEWPPRMEESELAVAGGWPWRWMSESESESTHDFIHFIGRFTGGSDTNLGMALLKSSSLPWGQRSLPPDANLGGMSGGPLYALRETPVIHLELVGIIYEYHQLTELALARPLTMIKPDGTLITG